MHEKDHLLRSFVAVAKAKSLMGAAARLGVSQPALSKQISVLETSIGMPLFTRTGRGMTLTSVGTSLLEEATHGFEVLDRALSGACGAGAVPRGVVTIATINTLAAYFIPDVIERLRSDYPKIRITMLLASSPEVVERVERGRADIGLVYDLAVNTDDVVLHRLHREELGAYMLGPQRGADKTISIENLTQHQLILPPRPYALRKIVEREFASPLHIPFECNSVSLTLDLATKGLGSAILPLLLPTSLVESRGLVRYRIGSGQMRRSVAAIHAKAGSLAESVAVTLQTIVTVAKALPCD